MAMNRRVFAMFTMLSLILCVATIVIWIRSYSQVRGIRGFLRSSLQGNSGRMDFISFDQGTIIWSKQVVIGSWRPKVNSVSYEWIRAQRQLWPYKAAKIAGFEWSRG